MTPAKDEFAKLRELAEKATAGSWEATDGVVWIDTCEQVCCQRSTTECCGMPDVIGGQEKIADSNTNDAEYIAAANPATILRLLARLDAMQEVIAAANAFVDRTESLKSIAGAVALGEYERMRAALSTTEDA